MSVYRGAPCPDCHAEGRINRCPDCAGVGTLLCDLCNGTGMRVAPGGLVPCNCHSGHYVCATCSGGTGVCGRCGGTGFLGT